MTGPQGGFWVPLGGQLKDIWEKAIPGLKVQSLPGAGIANVRGIEEGKAEIGFGNTISTADAVAGTGEAPLDKKHDNVCNVATLYPQYFQVVVLADAASTRQGPEGQGLRHAGKGNTGELITRHVLKVSGLTYNDVKVSFTTLHRQRRADEGQPDARVRARHRHPGQLDHGPRVGARHQAARPEPTSTRTCRRSTRPTSW